MRHVFVLGSPIDAKSQSGRTALHVASAEGQHRVVEVLKLIPKPGAVEIILTLW